VILLDTSVLSEVMRRPPKARLHRRRRRTRGQLDLAAALVHFAPGARTAWHTHPHGQTIFVTESVGRGQREAGRSRPSAPATASFFELGENQWRAAPNRCMAHVAMQQDDESGSPWPGAGA
jgi:quercetin dioxygenase-like cupin family protein